MGFYEEMADVARELLAPTDEDGLGQGEIALVRLVPGAPPAYPWDPPSEPTQQRTPLDGAARGVSKELVGAPIENGGQIIATDLVVIVSVPESGFTADNYQPGDVLELDGELVTTILSVKNIPAAGTVCAIQFVVRR